MKSLDDKAVVEARIVFPDGHQEDRRWTWREVQDGNSPDLTVLANLHDWMDDPRKTWTHPQDPIIYSTQVKPGREEDARAWLASL